MTSILLPTRKVDIRFYCGFMGLGGGAKGFANGHARVEHLEASMRCIGGFDVDPAAARDVERVAKAKCTVLDLFDRPQYIAFHGHEPPAGWREATPEDIRRSAGYEHPHIVFLSPPCKGFSGLLSEQRSRSAKYQALNALTIRGVMLMLEAWADNPPEFFLLENVPRIATRGAHLVDAIRALLHSYGYATAPTTHDCGEIGGLGQTRKRFLLVGRHREKVPPFLYEPVKRPLRSVGEVLGAFPLPGDPKAGPMHGMRKLQWKTWARLAFVEAGGDWRSLRKLRVVDGRLADYVIMPERYGYPSALGVTAWDSPGATVTGDSHPSGGRFAVADPRIEGAHNNVLGVTDWAEHAGTVAGASRPGNGKFSVADPRLEHSGEYSQLGVLPWNETAGTVSGQSAVGGGRFAVADPRLGEDDARHWNKYRVVPWDGAAGTVVGNAHRPGGGEQSVADPRLNERANRHANGLRVVDWDGTAATIIGPHRPGGGDQAVADPRLQGEKPRFNNVYAVTRWDEPREAVTGGGGPSAGGVAVADPRPGLGEEAYKTAGHYGVVPWDAASRAVTGTAGHDNGPFNVADPRSTAGDDWPGLPAPEDRLVAVIRALDGTWHRPFTTLELAALQGLVDPDEYLVLDGTSDSAWRERIGNAVPAPAAQAIANVMATTLLLAWLGETFTLSSQSIWVRPVQIALAVETGAIQ